MKRSLTSHALLLAASIAGLSACNTGKRVEQESQDLNQAKQEAANEQAQLRQEQRQEQIELTEEQRHDNTDMVGRTKPAEERVEERVEERAELNQDQAAQRQRLNERQNERIRDEQEDVTEAARAAAEQRADIMKDSRKELGKMDERAAELRSKAAQASVEERAAVDSALSAYPSRRDAVERDIEALDTVKAANLNRAKDKVEKQLSKLDQTLDRAESKL